MLALRLLIEGNSLSSTEPITDIDRNTITKLLVLAGEKCEKVMGRLIVNVLAKDVQADEIWGYVAKKYPWEANDNSIGDAYCFVAIERKMKLVLNFALGRRDQATTDIFIEGLRAATSPKQRFQRRVSALRLCDHDHAFRPMRFRATHQSLRQPARRRATVFAG